jgi:hypothetical protein
MKAMVTIELPKNCTECPLCDCEHQKCKITGNVNNLYMGKIRAPSCPLIINDEAHMKEILDELYRLRNLEKHIHNTTTEAIKTGKPERYGNCDNYNVFLYAEKAY